MKSIAFKISDEVASEFVLLYGNRNRGAQRAVEGWNKLREKSVDEINRIFTPGEIYRMIIVITTKNYDNNLTLNQEIFVQFMIESIKDYQSTDFLDELVLKIRKLTFAQVFFLIDWCSCVNLRQDDYSEIIKTLAKKED